MEGPTSKKIKEPPQRQTTSGTSSFWNPSIAISISNKERGGPLKECLA